MKTDNEFLLMTSDDYDKYMCERYPIMFCERNMDMSQTCMCWGFKIGAGWRKLLADVCEKILYLEKTIYVSTVFKQVKQKLGGARFYHTPTSINPTLDNKLVYDIIDDIVSYAESQSYHICEECSTYIEAPIIEGRWIHALCDDCFTQKMKIRGGEDCDIRIDKAILRKRDICKAGYLLHTMDDNALIRFIAEQNIINKSL